MDGNNDDVIEDRIKGFYQNKKIILNTFESKQIIVKTLAQKRYLEALESANIIFVTGPAGTGRRYAQSDRGHAGAARRFPCQDPPFGAFGKKGNRSGGL